MKFGVRKHLTLLAMAVMMKVLMLIAPTSASTVVLARGQCPVVGTQPNFNMLNFLGTWYELKSFEQGSAVCVSARYTHAGNSTYVVENTGFALQRRFRGGTMRVPLRVVGTATVPDPRRPADLLLDFDGSAGQSKKPNYSIVSTDYSTYAVVFSCTPYPGRNLNMHGAWILTRTRGVAPPNLSRLEAGLRDAGVSVNSFTLSGQSNCPDDIPANAAAAAAAASVAAGGAPSAAASEARRLARKQRG